MDKFNCECGCIINKSSKARHIKTSKHINLIKLNKEDRKAQLNINNRTLKITCECGSIVLKRQLDRHKKTTKHFKLIKQDTN